jgi:hypothetical protein
MFSTIVSLEIGLLIVYLFEVKNIMMCLKII